MKKKAVIFIICFACISELFSQNIEWKSKNKLISSGKIIGQYQFTVGGHALVVENGPDSSIAIYIDGIKNILIIQNMLGSIAQDASIWGESYFQIINGFPADIKINFSFNRFYGKYFHIINIILDKTEDFVFVKTILIEGYDYGSHKLPEDLHIYFFDEMVSLDI